jgi:hypothetical protein
MTQNYDKCFSVTILTLMMKTTANVSASMQTEVNYTPKDDTFHTNTGTNKRPNKSDSTAGVSGYQRWV